MMAYWDKTEAPHRKSYEVDESELYVRIRSVQRSKHTPSSHLIGKNTNGCRFSVGKSEGEKQLEYPGIDGL
jgi:hypothetical protein